MPKATKRLSVSHPLLGSDVAAFHEQAQDLVERHADLAELVRQVEQRAVLPVPAGEAQIAVEDGDALLHLVERDLEEVAIVLQRLGGIVQQAVRVARRCCRCA
jgi:hypothetical protein